jgi:signal transduction histidine kinase
MSRRCRELDWAATPLGPPEQWSQSLRTTCALVLTSRNPMFLWWGPELIQIYNDAYRPSFGRTGRHPRALGMHGRECWTDIWETIGPQIEQVMTTGQATWHEDQYIPIERNGRLEDVWWTYSYSPVFDDDGSVQGTLVVCLETTQRVLSERERERMLAETARAEAAFRESEARYRLLFESLDEGFCVIETLFDARGRCVDYVFLEANPAFVAQTGLENALGRRVREMVPQHEDHWFQIYGRVALTGKATRFEAPAEALARWYDVYAFRVGEPEEHRVAVLFKDVTRAKESEREREQLVVELEVERARLVEVFRQAPTFMAVLRGPDHVFEFVNDAYYTLIGHREVIGRPLREALPEVTKQGFLPLLDGVLASGVPYVGREVPILLVRSPGVGAEERFVDFVYQPLTEADGSLSGLVAHGSDVTEQVIVRRDVERLLEESERARAEAEAARAEAETANRAKSEFLAVMSHELRTPLNAIGGYAELIEMGIRGPTTPQQREDLRRLQGSQQHLLGLINEVLNYAKLETSSVLYSFAPVAIGDALRDAELLVTPQAGAKGLAVRLRASSPSWVVRADPEKLRQILVNLLSNAVKFTPSGGEIEMWCEEGEGHFTIAVRDTGIGIPEDKLLGIFDPFVQVRTDLTRPHEGTGLGLAISRELARGMGGDLTVESRLNEGSTFYVTLPRDPATSPERTR